MYRCFNCSDHFYSKSSTLGHIRLYEMGGWKPYQCMYCLQSQSVTTTRESEESLKNHVQSVHPYAQGRVSFIYHGDHLKEQMLEGFFQRCPLIDPANQSTISVGPVFVNPGQSVSISPVISPPVPLKDEIPTIDLTDDGPLATSSKCPSPASEFPFRIDTHLSSHTDLTGQEQCFGCQLCVEMALDEQYMDVHSRLTHVQYHLNQRQHPNDFDGLYRMCFPVFSDDLLTIDNFFPNLNDADDAKTVVVDDTVINESLFLMEIENAESLITTLHSEMSVNEGTSVAPGRKGGRKATTICDVFGQGDVIIAKYRRTKPWPAIVRNFRRKSYNNVSFNYLPVAEQPNIFKTNSKNVKHFSAKHYPKERCSSDLYRCIMQAEDLLRLPKKERLNNLKK